MITKKYMRHILACGVACCSIATMFTACNDDDIPENFYSATKVTAAGFIENDADRFSAFNDILVRGNYLSMLKTYGTYTVFAPTNDAIQTWLSQNGYNSVQDLPQAQCDTIARNHIVKTRALFTTDFSASSAPMNMNDTYIELSCDSDVNNNNALIVYVNKHSKIIEKDDSVTNGVVHVVDRVLTASSQFLPELMEEDPSISLFCQALRLTGMADSLSHYLDDSYFCDDDSVTKGVIKPYGTANGGGTKTPTAYFPEKRYFKYSAFVETDSIYHEHGIDNMNDLIAYAKRIYDETYPADAGLYDDDFKNRKNPLNRFVSYHLINRIGLYEDWIIQGAIMEKCFDRSAADPEDYYETMCPHTTMRFCCPSHGLFINRKGLARNAKVKGVRVLTREESGTHNQQARNGIYHYIDDILVYSTEVRDVVFNRRMRVDFTTLSPDFMNVEGGTRGHHIDSNPHSTQSDEFLTAFKRGYVTDWEFSPETFIGVSNERTSWWHYQGQGVAVIGLFDVSVKLPPVPSGTYEVRLGYTIGPERGVAQVYLNNIPCGIPVDLRVGCEGYEPDTEDDEENLAIDKAMRNLGFMKAPDSYRPGGGATMRENGIIRRILTTEYLDENQEYWLRFRQVLDDPNCYISLDYLELCPKSVYASPEGEDRH